MGEVGRKLFLKTNSKRDSPVTLVVRSAPNSTRGVRMELCICASFIAVFPIFNFLTYLFIF